MLIIFSVIFSKENKICSLMRSCSKQQHTIYFIHH